jgi:hypothetical protein
MYTILSYLKDLTCNAQFNFCFSSYYSFKPFLFFEAFSESLSRSAPLPARTLKKDSLSGSPRPPFHSKESSAPREQAELLSSRLATGFLKLTRLSKALAPSFQMKEEKNPKKETSRNQTIKEQGARSSGRTSVFFLALTPFTRPAFAGKTCEPSIARGVDQTPIRHSVQATFSLHEGKISFHQANAIVTSSTERTGREKKGISSTKALEKLHSASTPRGRSDAQRRSPEVPISRPFRPRNGSSLS